MDIGSLKRDSSKIEAGEWVSDIPGMGDVRLRVRGLSSPTVAALRAAKERKVPRNDRERDGSLNPTTALLVLGEVLHEAVLLEWDGLESGGKPQPYDKALARKLLTDPDFSSFADAVVWASSVVDKGHFENREEVGNGSKKSSTAASTATS